MEKLIESKLVKLAVRLGGLAWKWVSPGTAGVPDRIVLLPGARIVFVETKDRGEKPDKRQLYRKAQLEALGFDVRVIDRAEDLEALENEIRAAQLPATDR